MELQEAFKESRKKTSKRRLRPNKFQRQQNTATIVCIVGVVIITLLAFLWMNKAYTDSSLKSCMQEHTQYYCEKNM